MFQLNLSHRNDIPPGWRRLFDELVADLDREDPSLMIVQAKQKFGELRVYLKTYSPASHEIINAATRTSKQTCEICGAEASLRVTRGYYQTLCTDHAGESTPP